MSRSVAASARLSLWVMAKSQTLHVGLGHGGEALPACPSLGAPRVLPPRPREGGSGSARTAITESGGGGATSSRFFFLGPPLPPQPLPFKALAQTRTAHQGATTTRPFGPGRKRGRSHGHHRVTRTPPPEEEPLLLGTISPNHPPTLQASGRCPNKNRPTRTTTRPFGPGGRAGPS